MDSSREQDNLNKLYGEVPNYKTIEKGFVKDIFKQCRDILHSKTGDIVELVRQLNNYSPEDGEDKNEKNKMKFIKITPGSCEQSRPARDAVEICVREESGPIESETVADTVVTHGSKVSHPEGKEVITRRLATAAVVSFYSSADNGMVCMIAIAVGGCSLVVFVHLTASFSQSVKLDGHVPDGSCRSASLSTPTQIAHASPKELPSLAATTSSSSFEGEVPCNFFKVERLGLLVVCPEAPSVTSSEHLSNPENGNSSSEGEGADCNSGDKGDAGGDGGGCGERDGSCDGDGDGGCGDEGNIANSGGSSGGGGGGNDDNGRGSGKNGVEKKVKKKKKKKKGKKPGRGRSSNDRFPSAIPQAGHKVDRPEKGSESGDDPSSESEEDSPDEFSSITNVSEQPSRFSTRKEGKHNGNHRVTASLEEVAEKKQQHPSLSKLDRFHPPVESSTVSSDTDQEYPSAVQEKSSSSTATSQENTSSSGADQPSPCVPAAAAPHNSSLETLRDEAVPTVLPSVRDFNGTEAQQQQPRFSDPVRVSHHDVMDENLVHAVGPRGDHYRSSLLTSHPSLPNPSLPHVVELPEFSRTAREWLVLTPSEMEALTRLGIRVRYLLDVLRDLPLENLPIQLIFLILIRVANFAINVLEARGRLTVQLMEGLQIRVDNCTVVVQSDVYKSVFVLSGSCGPTCGPLVPPILGLSDGPACISTAMLGANYPSRTGGSTSGMSWWEFIELILVESNLQELWDELWHIFQLIVVFIMLLAYSI